MAWATTCCPRCRPRSTACSSPSTPTPPAQATDSWSVKERSRLFLHRYCRPHHLHA
jgi:hypothetical protein